MKDCLEDNREQPGFSAECKEEFEAMMEARAADFRLDSTLREVRCARQPPLTWPGSCNLWIACTGWGRPAGSCTASRCACSAGIIHAGY